MPPSDTLDRYIARLDPHAVARVTSTARRGAALGGLVLALEAGLTAALLEGGIGPAAGLLLHLLLSAALAWLAWRWRDRPADGRFLALLTLATATTGVLGAAGSLLSLILSRYHERAASSFAAWFEALFPPIRSSRPQMVYHDLSIGRDESDKAYSVLPFLDVLAYGDDDQKRRALGKITSQFHPAFAPVLHKALQDESNMIRVQGATAIALIENRFSERQMLLSRLHDAHGKDPVILLALAEFYDDYAFTGILDGDRESMNREKAEAYYRDYLAAMPQADEVMERLGRLLLRQGKLADAAQWFERALAREMTGPRLSWLAECRYRQGDYTALRALAAQVQADHPALFETLDGKLAEVMQSWATEGRAA